MYLQLSRNLTGLALAALACSAQAQVGTGSLSGWTSVGDAASQGGSLWLSTAFIDGVDDGGGYPFASSAVDIASVETAAGLAPYALDLAPDDYATEGSLVSQSFTASAGQRLSFQWSFSTAETLFEDHAFVVINGQVSTLATRSAPGAAVNSFSQLIGQDGLVRLSFGVVDTQDVLGVSVLRIDNLQLAAVPEPMPSAMLLAGLGVLGWVGARRRRGSARAASTTVQAAR